MVKKIIETFNLIKIFNLKGKNRKITALDNINIEINEGEIFGLLGPNGAGKTTMVQILTTLIQPTSGYAMLDGINVIKKPRAIKDKISVLLGDRMIYRRITGYDNLKFFCKIYDIQNYKEKIFKIAKEFLLDKWLNQYVENYSRGMRVKLALCRALILDKSILFLDEPTTGLDITARLHIIQKLKNLNKTIFLTSHNMNVVDKLCDRIAFIDKGKILHVGTQQELKKLIESEIKINIRIENNQHQLINELNTQNFIIKTEQLNNNIKIILLEDKYYKDLFLILSKYDVKYIQEQDMSLDDLFVKIIY